MEKLKAFERKGTLLGVLLWLASQATAQAPPPAEEEPPAAAPAEPSISLKLLLPRIATDQKRIWSFLPAAALGRSWKPVLGTLGVTAGLVALDPVDTPYFRRTTAFRGFNRVLSGRNAGLAIAIVPASFFVGGFVRKDAYASQTALLAGEAAANGEILSLVMKDVDRRLRPVDVAPGGDFSGTWFQGKSRPLAGLGSFPSGHAMTAFSVATVFAERYRSHRWAPWVAYGLAGLIGFSRVSGQAHFPSDVFLGAALGYSISHYVVLRHQNGNK
jgi:membrane-associated phospholipid phosphatase